MGMLLGGDLALVQLLRCPALRRGTTSRRRGNQVLRVRAVSNAEVTVSSRSWWQERIAPYPDTDSRAEPFLASLWSISLLFIDISVVLGAFLVAHWIRFVAPDAGVQVLELDRYVVMGLSIGAL